MISVFVLLATVVNAAVLQSNKARDARPGNPVVRDLPVTSSADPTTFSTITSSVASTTEAPILPQLAVETPCTPSSICLDGFTCGMRYGGCYDKNYCDGNTSPFPIPTCVTIPTIISIPTTTPTTIPTADRAAADDDDDDDVSDNGDIMEEEQGDGRADAVVGSGTGN